MPAAYIEFTAQAPFLQHWNIGAGSHEIRFVRPANGDVAARGGELRVTTFAALPGLTLPEALESPDILWETGGDYGGWLGVSRPDAYNGGDNAESTPLGRSWLEGHVQGPAHVSFVMPYGQGKRLRFLLDAQLIVADAPSRLGEAGPGWHRFVVEVPSGPHVLRWESTDHHGRLDHVQTILNAAPIASGLDLGPSGWCWLLASGDPIPSVSTAESVNGGSSIEVGEVAAISTFRVSRLTLGLQGPGVLANSWLASSGREVWVMVTSGEFQKVALTGQWERFDIPIAEGPQNVTWHWMQQGPNVGPIYVDWLTFSPSGLSYDGWVATTSLAEGTRARDADPDGDGIANLAEFATGTDPSDPASAPHLEFSLTGDRLTTFMPAPKYVVDGVTAVIEASPDLVTWSQDGVLPLDPNGSLIRAEIKPAAFPGADVFVRARFGVGP
ncbi:MAG: thrombospondin type 3 repeat-containing protein [Verrucomicrobiales bacterium]